MIMTYEDMMTLTHCHDHILTENIWFVWFVKWRNGDVTDADAEMSRMRNTQIVLLSLWTVGTLSFANWRGCCTGAASILSSWPKEGSRNDRNWVHVKKLKMWGVTNCMCCQLTLAHGEKIGGSKKFDNTRNVCLVGAKVCHMKTGAFDCGGRCCAKYNSMQNLPN